ncbi:32633_t:CDS:1, partial [Gigaspora margarita]
INLSILITDPLFTNTKSNTTIAKIIRSLYEQEITLHNNNIQ